MDESVNEKVTAFFTQFKHQTYKKGEILIRADDDPSGVFFIQDGLVIKYVISKKGEELVVHVYRPNSFFPMSWAINNTHNKYFYEAVRNTEVYRAPKEKVLEFFKNEPDEMYNLISRIYKSVDRLLMRMVYITSGNAYNRLITELLIYAKRFGIQDKKSGYVTFKLTGRNLASLTGMTRETISRELKILKDKKLLESAVNNLTIYNMKRLEEELEDNFNESPW